MTDYISRADALAVIQHCKDPVKAIEDLPGVGWIPVTESLPEEEGEYITMTNRGVIAQRYETTIIRGQRVQRWHWYGGLSRWATTHWMPMPLPPKEGEP